MNRIFAGIFGGFLLSIAVPLCAAVFGPFGLQGNLVLTIMIALPTWVAGILRAFFLDSVKRAWCELVGASVLLIIAAIVRIQFFGIPQV